LFLRLSHDFVPQSLCLALLCQRPIGPNFPDRLVHHRAMRLRNLHQAGALRFGFSKIYDGGQVLEAAACWAQVRRKFVDLHELHQSPLAAQALERIGALYAIE
jgi:transposase